MIDKWTHIFLWIFFITASVFLTIFYLDRIFFSFGYLFIPWFPISSGLLLQLIPVTLLFVIVLLLRQIREALKK